MYDYSEEPLSIRDRFPWMRPIDQVPTLFRVLGTGTTMVGRRNDHPETRSYVSTHCLTVLFIPVLALGAYRVQDSPGGGWYFLGRESVSVLGWCGNILSALLLLTGLCFGGWYLRIGSSEHRAGKDLDRADELAKAGQLGEAAVVLREVMGSRTTYVPTARKKLTALLDVRTGPAQEMLRLFSVAADLERQGDPLVQDLYARGYSVADALSQKDPEGAMKVLDVIAPLAGLPNDPWKLERQIAEAMVKEKPDDVERVSRLAAVLWLLDEPGRCKELVEPFADKLVALDGAAVLGRLYLREGRYEDARKILAPFVDSRLKGYREAMRAQNVAVEGLIRRMWDMINNRRAPGFDFAKYDAAPNEDAKKPVVVEYFQRLFTEDVGVRVANHLLARERLTMDAILDLGLAQVHLAQQEADADTRRAGLEKAEATFRSIQAEVKHNDEYKRRLAQVCYWLGKPEEGRRLLDEMMAAHKSSAMSVSLAADTLRGVGAVTEARKLVEDAYNRETDKQNKFQLAMTRALIPHDLDDRILWLERADPEAVEVRISLYKERGTKALEAGKEEEAAKLFRQAVEAYAGLGDNVGSLNNAALAYFKLYDVTFDPETWEQGRKRLEKAFNQTPSDPIVVRNYADAQRTSAAAELVGAAIDCKTMRRRPSLDLLAYLYSDTAGHAKAVERMKAHAQLTQARGCYERLMVLGPRDPGVYGTLAWLYELTGDRDALRKLADRVEGLELDLGDVNLHMREHLDGKKDAQRRKEAEASLALAEKALEPARKVKGATAAAAAVRLSERIRALAVYAPADLDRAVKMAEEAHKDAPSEATRSALISALLQRAVEDLTKADPTFAEMARVGKRGLGSFLIQWALLGGGKPAEAVLANADVREAMKLKAEQVRLMSQGRGPSAWALLKDRHAKEAELVAGAIREAGTESAKLRIDARTAPLSAVTAVEQAWLLRMDGKAADAKALLDKRAADGVRLPTWGR